MGEDGGWPRPEGGGAMVTMRQRDSVPDWPPGERARRFADIVKLNGLGTRLIDRAQERRLLEEGIGRFGLSLDEARGLLRAVAEDHGYAFEAETGRRIQQILARHAGRGGVITKRVFNQTADMLGDFSDQAIGRAEARRQVKRIMAENGWRPGRAGLFRTTGWYRQIQA